MDVQVLRPERPLPAPDTGLDSPPPTWDLAFVAPVVSGLLGRALAVEQVRDKAAGLGLLRCPELGQKIELTAKALSRLFLAGYRIPAHAITGTLSAACLHIAQDRRVFVCSAHLRNTPLSDPLEASLLEAVRIDSDSSGPVSILLRPLVTQGEAPDVLLDRCGPEWRKLDVPMVVAARRWEALAIAAQIFFGGGRDADETYHWEVAECATDDKGSIVRCY
jgi:hypothetical protein